MTPPFPKSEAEYRALIGFDPEHPDWVPTYEERPCRCSHGLLLHDSRRRAGPCGKCSCSGWREAALTLGLETAENREGGS